MFTGIIENKGKVVRVECQGRVRRLVLEVPLDLTEICLGDSINVNGACLTVAEKKGRMVSVDLSSETLQRTNLTEVREGEEVNLERALRLQDRLGGHIVTGHIDGIGTITEARRDGDFVQTRVQTTPSLGRYIVQKGSIAVDGISLTVNEWVGDEIQLTLIPFTLEKTTLLKKKVGDHVNLEVDILGKYVESLLKREDVGSKGLERNFLKEHGFLKE